ncbi:MAG: hypothetical protein ACK5JO_01970 [Halodesulfovibrio sp.]
MADYTSEAMEVRPYLDMELLMSVSQESRVDGNTMDLMGQLWEKWAPHLSARKLKVGKIQYLAVWLADEVEADVDNIWDESPSSAYLAGSLAQVMVMCALNQLLPEVQDAGCAPAPKPTDGLVDAMEAEGCPYNEQGTMLSRKFAIVTHYPFKGACEICYLQKDCPKGSGSQDSGSIVLPGYERGDD